MLYTEQSIEREASFTYVAVVRPESDVRCVAVVDVMVSSSGGGGRMRPVVTRIKR